MFVAVFLNNMISRTEIQKLNTAINVKEEAILSWIELTTIAVRESGRSNPYINGNSIIGIKLYFS